METVQIIQLLLIAVGLFAITVGCWQCWKIKNTRRNTRAVEVNIHIVPTGALQPPNYTESNNTHMKSQSPACDMTVNNVNNDGRNATGTKFDKGDAIGKKYKIDGGNNGKVYACNISDDSGLKSSGEDCDATSKNRDDNHAESNSDVKFKSHNDTVEKLDGGSTDYEGFLKFNFN